MLPALTRWIQSASRRTPARRGAQKKLNLLRLEDRAVPAIVGVIGSGPGINGTVVVFDETGATVATFNPYPGFTGGVNVAAGDITGDGVLDIVTGAGPGGGAHVLVFDGAGLMGGITTPLYSLIPVYGTLATPFLGGVFVGAGDLDGDGFADVVTGPGEGGGPHVKGFNVAVDGNNAINNSMVEFNAYSFVGPTGVPFTFGVRVALGDFGGDNGGVAGSKFLGDAEIATAPGPGGGPHVTFWDYDFQRFDPDYYGNLVPVIIGQPGDPDFFEGFDPNYRGGFSVTAGYYTNNKDEEGFIYTDLAIAADVGPLPNQQGGPHMLTYRLDGFFSPDQRSDARYIPASRPPGINEVTGLPEDVQPNVPLSTRFNYALAFPGGSRIAGVVDLNNDNVDELLIAPGQGLESGNVPDIYVVSGIDASLFFSLEQPFGAAFQGGAFVG
jgi:hypothetical protein